MTGSDYRKWLAIGTGIGIEIGRENLNVSVVRVRPSGGKILGELIVPRFREQAAAEWGATYSQFLKKLGIGHLAATALLPRDELTVRQVSLPGVADKDLAAAVRFEIDALNPYAEEDVAYDWARIGGTSSILVGITRRATVDSYSALFSQAGIKVASFTFSAAAIYSAARLHSNPPADGFVALEAVGGEVEVYGESAAKPLFSARMDQPVERARAIASAELRLAPEIQPSVLHESVSRPSASPADYDAAGGFLSYATALAAGSIRPAIRVNLLPPELRQQTSRLRYIPTAVLASVMVLLLAAVIGYQKYADRQYAALLQREIQKLEPAARKAAGLDRQINIARNRAQTLDNFRLHTKDDLDALRELTDLLPPPAFVNSFQLTRNGVVISGEAEQAAPLIKLLDGSTQFRGSSFAVPIGKTASGEAFSIRASRQGVAP